MSSIIPQLAYAVNANKAFAGMLASASGDPLSIISRASEEVAAIPFGVGVTSTGATDPVEQFLTPNGAADVVMGVVAHTHALANRGLLLDAGVETGDVVDVVRLGKLWVPVEQTVVPHVSPVFLRHTANGGADQPGFWRIDVDGANAIDLSAVADWLDFFVEAGDHSQVGIALLDINLPGA